MTTVNTHCIRTSFFSGQKVKNLRSVVARGAIACLGDLFALMKGAMEQVRHTSQLLVLPSVIGYYAYLCVAGPGQHNSCAAAEVWRSQHLHQRGRGEGPH